jgi:ADP-ribosylglycohydrolase
MKAQQIDRNRIKGAWEGRISGCQLGKPVEIMSNFLGLDLMRTFLKNSGALPLRDYIPYTGDPFVDIMGKLSCKEHITRSEPDDDINYTVLALIMLEKYGLDLTTQNVASSWLISIPAGRTFTAEKAAYKMLLSLTTDATACLGLPPDFDLSACSMNEWSDWIGAMIRADMYGWVCPGRPDLAAHLARQDATLSHTGDGVEGAAFIAALGALVPATGSILDAVESAVKEIPENSGAFESVKFGISIAGKDDAVVLLHDKYKDYPAVHVLNNLALVVWAILTYEDDFSAAIGETVAAGLDTDCNGATVGGILGLTGKPIHGHWTKPWNNRVAVDLAGIGELDLNELADRTVAVAEKIRVQSACTS